MIEAAGTDQVVAFDAALAAALEGEVVTDTGLSVVVVDALTALAALWPTASEADVATVRAVFAGTSV